MTQIQNQTPHSEYFFTPGDAAGEAQFLMWHHLRHIAYDQKLSLVGTQVSNVDLRGKVDSDWLKRHIDRHNFLRKISGGGGNSLVGLVDVNWDSSSQVHDWLRIHAIDHKKLDAYFGLA